MVFNGGVDSADDVVNKVRTSVWKREVRAAKTLFFIISYFFICWYPLHILDAIMAFSTIRFPIHLINVFIYLSHSNSAINPFLYAFTSREFRAAFQSIFREWFPCCNIPVDKLQLENTSFHRNGRMNSSPARNNHQES